jgi:phage terminase small subunit
VPRPKLTPKQQLWLSGYLANGGNAAMAARDAGYSARTAKQAGTENLAKPALRVAIAKAQDRQLERGQALADDVVDGLRRLAFTDRTAIFDSKDNLIAISKWPDDVKYCVESIEIVKRNAFAGDGRQDVIYKVRFAPKLPAHIEVAKVEGRYPKEPPQVVTAVSYQWGDPSTSSNGKGG